MITSTLVKNVISHGLVFCLGIGAAMFFDGSSPDEPLRRQMSQRGLTRRAERKATPDRLSSPSAFRAAYSDLVARPMTRSERQNCMGVFWQEWAASDPEAMLAFLENKRVWPEDCKAYMDLGLAARPDLVVDFALRYGCNDALQGLYQGDLLANARLLAALPEEQRGQDVLNVAREIDRRLGMSGAEVDVPSAAYLRGAAESLIEEGRIDEFFDAFAQIEDPVEKKELAKKFGEVLSEEKPGEKVLALILRLPEPFREQAAYELKGHSGSTAMECPEVREERKRWIERLAEEGLIEIAANNLYDFFGNGDAVISGEEWAAWIARFPEGDSWRPITKAIFDGWSRDDRETMVRQICALPAGPTRDRMADEAAAATIGSRVQPFDEQDQKIFDSLANLQTDPQAKARFVKKFGQSDASGNGNTGELPHDPFAVDRDPFSDTKE